MNALCSPYRMALLVAPVMLIASGSVLAVQGRVVVPGVTGKQETHPFVGHPGWIDQFGPGYGKSASARIQDDATFELPEPKGSACLILMFDRIETPPIVIPHWPPADKSCDIVIPAEYACVPEGPPESWNTEWIQRGLNLFQTFVPRGTHLYGLTLLHKPNKKLEANKFQLMLHEDGPEGKVRFLTDTLSPDPGWQGQMDRVSAEKDDGPMARAGWRHGDMPVEPGRTYAIRAEGYRTHGGTQYTLDGYVRPDGGDGYADGKAFADGKALGGDLCCLVFSDCHGQYVENQIRAEDWEIFLPGHRPTTQWGQTFLAHGVSLAGVSFWAVSENDEQMMCEVRVREEGPWGKILKPVKIARSQPSTARPRIVYPDIPGRLPEYRSYYESTPKLFQIAYLPDEVTLTPGKTYYIELVPTKPLLVFADGWSYENGHAYYEGLKVERQEIGHKIFHSTRWTLLMNIVTYARPGGEPLGDK